MPIVYEGDCVTATGGGVECVYKSSNADGGADAEFGRWDEEVLDVTYEEELERLLVSFHCSPVM